MLFLLHCTCNFPILNIKGVGLWCLTPLSTIFQYIMAVSFIGEGNRRTQRKPSNLARLLQMVV